jgi:3-oxoacyl-ACP reductase-like protein
VRILDNIELQQQQQQQNIQQIPMNLTLVSSNSLSNAVIAPAGAQQQPCTSAQAADLTPAEAALLDSNNNRNNNNNNNQASPIESINRVLSQISTEENNLSNSIESELNLNNLS